MYQSEFPLTEKEQTWDKVSYERMLQLLRQFPVVYNKRDTNSYGEFRFVTIYKSQTLGMHDNSLTFYFHGEHEYRGEAAVNFAYVYSNYSYQKDIQRLDREAVIREIEAEHQEYLSKPIQMKTPEQQTFSMIAELADDDFAIAEMEDLEEL